MNTATSCPTQRRKATAAARELVNRQKQHPSWKAVCTECGKALEPVSALAQFGDTYPYCDPCSAELDALAGTDREPMWDFADPGGRSAIAATLNHGACPRCECKVRPHDGYCRCCGTHLNSRRHPCPTCGTPDVLTDRDVEHHYQCDACADRAEGRYGRADY